METLGTLIRVWDWDGDSSVFDPIHEDDIRKAHTRWIVEKIDTVLHLRTLFGDLLTLPASDIRRWTVSTPEGRVRATALEAAAEAEEKQNQIDAKLREPWE